MAGGGSTRTSRVDAVLVSLRRGQRHLALDPRRTIEGAVTQLLALGRTHPVAVEPDPQQAYRIDDLARVSGVTVRNIRAYTERGLLHPARRVGRTVLFDDSHVARLKIITSMLERGYTSAHIVEMLSAWESGRDLGDILGLEKALIPPHDDTPTSSTLAQARELAGGRAEFDLLVAAGLIERNGNRVRLLRPTLLAAFAEMRELGVPLATLVDAHAELVPETDRIARILVSAGAEQFAPHFVDGEAPTSEEVEKVVHMLVRFRALAMASVTSTLAVSIEELIEQWLGDYLAHYVSSSSEAG